MLAGSFTGIVDVESARISAMYEKGAISPAARPYFRSPEYFSASYNGRNYQGSLRTSLYSNVDGRNKNNYYR